MKKKPSFFNITILKKDLTRFLPLWVCYLILGLLLTVSNFGNVYYSNAQTFGSSLQWLSVAMCGYALVTAQLLFGELFQGRLCNAIHALPVRREGLFLTHFAAGLLMGIVPNVVIALVGMLAMGRLWLVALVWLGAMILMYLLFFCIAAFCMICSGNRFAGVALYGLLNLLGVMVMWFFENFHMPMLYGLEMTDSMREIFYLFSPVWNLMNGDWIDITHSPGCLVNHYSAHYPQMMECQYYVESYGDVWGYLGIVTAVGVAFAAAALALYRKRHLESAGDFLSVKHMGLVFTLVASTFAGGVCYYLAGEYFIGMAIGMVVGFFICRMLLERTIKVFGKKSWLQFAALVLAVVLSFGLTYFDAFGVTRRIPKAEDVQSVTIADRYLSQWRLEQLNETLYAPPNQPVTVAVDPYYSYSKDGMMTLTESADIENIRQIHRLLLAEGDARKTNRFENRQTVTIHYQLKNGKTFTRYYYTAEDSDAMAKLEQYISQPRFILGYDTPEDMLKYLDSAQIYRQYHMSLEDPVWLEKLVAALYADAEAGQLSANGDGYACDLELQFVYENNYHGGQYLGIPKTAKHTLAFLDEYKIWYDENMRAAA